MTASAESRPAWASDDLVARLHARAGAARWGVTPARFAQALDGAMKSRFGAGAGVERPNVSASAVAGVAAVAGVIGVAGAGAGASGDSAAASPSASVSAAQTDSRPGGAPDAATVERFLEALHLEDLALAAGCADGAEAAWDAFVSAHRAELRRAAGAIAGVDRADDLCDALLGELFGVDVRGRARASLFGYFHGRSRLSTWLRAVLAQRHVDLLRAGRRTVALESDEQAEALAPPVQPELPDPDRARLISALQQALDSALAALDPSDRFRLVCYHIDGMTLAEMGRLFREHEATASRKLTRIRARVRESAESFLARERSLTEAQIRLAFEYALEEGGVQFARLTRGAAAGAASGAALEVAPAAPVAGLVETGKNAALDRS